MSRPLPSPHRVGRARVRSWLPAGVWLLASACGPGVATPMPEPPAAVFDLSGVDKAPLPTTVPVVGNDGKYVNGADGTVPGGATVRITNLDQTTVVFATTADADGAFLALAFANTGDELRFEWTKDAQRSAPADGIVLEKPPTERTIGVRASERFDCLKLEPGYVLDFSSVATQALTLVNACDAAVTLSNPRTRLGLPDFELNEALPLALEAGETGALRFAFTRGADGLREDIWFADVALNGATIRYPITLRAE